MDRIVVALNGVTGRMGYRHHPARTVRDQGGPTPSAERRWIDVPELSL